MALAQGLVKPHCCAPAKAAVLVTGEQGKQKLLVSGWAGGRSRFDSTQTEVNKGCSKQAWYPWALLDL